MSFKDKIEEAKRLVEADESYAEYKWVSRYDWMRGRIQFSNGHHSTIRAAVERAREFLKDCDELKENALKLVKAWDEYPHGIKPLSKSEWIKERVPDMADAKHQSIWRLVDNAKKILAHYNGSIFDTGD